MRKIIFLMLICCTTQINFGQVSISKFIHVDQFGYFLTGEKVAVLSDPIEGYNSDLAYSPSDTIYLKNSITNEIVFSSCPKIWNEGTVNSQSGDRGWWFDFTEVTTEGVYYVSDDINNERSANFLINENPYEDVLVAAGKMFYYNRCNTSKEIAYAGEKWEDETNFLNPLQDANCRYVFDPENELLEKDLSGGWFDAGDYNKYMSFAARTLNDLLSAYEINPGAFTTDWNIPESGDDVPDILDEAKWELDWMIKMVNSDGSAHLKQGSISFDENTETPPSENVDRRYYGPICTSASTSSAFTFSRAAIIYREIPEMEEFAEQLEELAILTYNYVLPFFFAETLETNCDDGAILAGDADFTLQDQLKQLLAASVYLYELTGNETYNTFFTTHYSEADIIETGNWNYYNLYIEDALLKYITLDGANESVAEAIFNSANLDVINNFEAIYGFTERDLYRAFMPDYSYHWGSNLPKAAAGSLNISTALNGLGTDSSSYLRKAAEQIHYFHGVNPLGIVYLTNMYNFGGERCANQMYHSWFWDGSIYDDVFASPNGPAPGFLTGGPNSTYSDETVSPPFGQPEMKSYLDFNDTYPIESFSITEPGIYFYSYN